MFKRAVKLTLLSFALLGATGATAATVNGKITTKRPEINLPLGGVIKLSCNSLEGVEATVSMGACTQTYRTTECHEVGDNCECDYEITARSPGCG